MHLRAPNRRKALFTLAGLVAGAGAPGCTHKSEPEPDRLVVATGPPGAVYREIGGEIALLLDERLDRTEVETVETGASRDNLSLLQEGRAHLGLANLDSILATEFSKEHDISAIGRLYDSFVHLVVLRKAPIGALSDLDGLRVSVGEVNSGTEFTVTQIIEKTGLQMEEVRLDQATSAEALAQGNIDAMFSLTGLPTPAIADLAEAREIRLIDLADTAEVMTDVSPDAYFPASIPATTYHGVPARPTFSVPNLLLCGGGLSDGFVHTVTDTVHRGAPRLASRRPEAAQINVRTGISTGIMPLHPGAAEWYREHKPA